MLNEGPDSKGNWSQSLVTVGHGCQSLESMCVFSYVCVTFITAGHWGSLSTLDPRLDQLTQARPLCLAPVEQSRGSYWPKLLTDGSSLFSWLKALTCVWPQQDRAGWANGGGSTRPSCSDIRHLVHMWTGDIYTANLLVIFLFMSACKCDNWLFTLISI